MQGNEIVHGVKWMSLGNYGMVKMVSLYFIIIVMFRFVSFFEKERDNICLSFKPSPSLGSCVRVFDCCSLSLPIHDSHILRVCP